MKPVDSVRIVILNDNKEFLILSETDDPDNYKLPGGKIETTDSSPQDASIRELKEELSLNPDTYSLHFITQILNDDGVSKRFIFLVDNILTPIKASDEIFKIIWCTKEKIPECKNRNHILAALSVCDY